MDKIWIKEGKFVALSDEQMKELSNEELGEYLNAQRKSFQDELQKSVDAKVSKKDLDTLHKSLSDNMSESVKQVQTILGAQKAQGEAIAKLLKDGAASNNDSVVSQIRKGLESNVEVLKQMKNSKSNSLQVSMTVSKAVGTMTYAASITGEIPQAQRLPGFNEIAVRNPYIIQLVGSGTATSNLITWVEEVAGEGDAGYTVEGATKNQLDADFKTASEKVEKLTVFIKVSEEMLEDIDYMASYINNKLLQKLDLKVDAELLSGAGGAGALNGIITQSTAYAAGVFALDIPTPNNWDVLKTAIDQVMIAHHMPNVILMHPSDVTAMGLSKGTDGHYVLPPFIASNGMSVDGVRIVSNTGMTADNFIVMDATKATVYTKNSVRIETGRDGNDFTKNLVTVLAEVRLAQVIEGNDKTAFVKGTFAAAIVALTKP